MVALKVCRNHLKKAILHVKMATLRLIYSNLYLLVDIYQESLGIVVTYRSTMRFQAFRNVL